MLSMLSYLPFLAPLVLVPVAVLASLSEVDAKAA